MAKQSAGVLLYRRPASGVEVLLVHPGGPFWAKKDRGSWSIPKGEFTDSEESLTAAKREFSEELGLPVPAGSAVQLDPVKQAGGKIVHAWAIEGDLDLERVQSNMFEMQWPPRSGVMQSFPEVDKAAWLPLTAARDKIVKGQLPLLDQLAANIGVVVDESGQSNPQTSLF